jgi:hypothetical protein
VSDGDRFEQAVSRLADILRRQQQKKQREDPDAWLYAWIARRYRKRIPLSPEAQARVAAHNRSRATQASERLKARWADPEARAWLIFCQRWEPTCRKGMHFRSTDTAVSRDGKRRYCRACRRLADAARRARERAQRHSE